MLKAVTFDLWDTIIHDDSDEPKRSASGLRSKREERRHLVWAALNQTQPIAPETVSLAYDVADAAFNHVWHQQHITWTVEERLRVLLDGLGRTLPDAAIGKLVRAHEEMEVTVCPDPIDGISEALEELSKRYKLGVVSDTIVSPGRCLRQWLDIHGLLGYFSGFAFSDEVGHSKPHPDMFKTVAQQLGAELHEMVHLGDRDSKDVQGPHGLGMKAILFTATRDRDKDVTNADAICSTHRELATIIDRLAAQS